MIINIEELIKLLQEANAKHGNLPVLYMNEVWLRSPDSYSIEEENEFGVQENIPKHIRLNGGSICD